MSIANESMKILLLGQKNSVTQTILEMLQSVDKWIVEMVSSLSDTLSNPSDENEQPNYDIIVANLTSYDESPNTLVRNIKSKLPAIPLLVLDTYGREFLISPLLESGASGYLQVGGNEAKLLEAVRKVADGNQHIITENTY